MKHEKIELFVQPPNRPEERRLIAQVEPNIPNYDAVYMTGVPLDRVLAIRRTKQRMIVVVT